jgi:hypothetical protein
VRFIIEVDMDRYFSHTDEIAGLDAGMFKVDYAADKKQLIYATQNEVYDRTIEQLCALRGNEVSDIELDCFKGYLLWRTFDHFADLVRNVGEQISRAHLRHLAADVPLEEILSLFSKLADTDVRDH